MSVFGPFFGSSIGAAIAQNILLANLRGRLLELLDPEMAGSVVEAGGSGISKVANSSTKPLIMAAYNYALGKVFVIAAVAGDMAFLSTLFIKWRTLKGNAKTQER